MRLKTILSAAALAVGCATGSAQAVTYDISWLGNGGYALTGTLSFADSLLGSGVIDETQISDLTINVLLDGRSQGTRSLAADGAGSQAMSFNLNFDTVAEQFVVGGSSDGPAGQDWFTSTGGASCDSIGFSSGLGAQAVCVGGSGVFSSLIPIGDSTLTATLSPVPLPAAGLLLLGALGAAAAISRRRKASV